MSKLMNDNHLFLKAVSIGVFSAVMVILIVMCIVAAIFLVSPSLPIQYLDYILLAADAFGAAVGAYIGARILKSRGLIVGVTIALLIFAALMISGFIGSQDSLSILTPLKAGILLLFGALAGIKGVNRKEKIRIR